MKARNDIYLAPKECFPDEPDDEPEEDSEPSPEAMDRADERAAYRRNGRGEG